MEKAAIVVNDVGKEFKLPLERRSSLKSTVINFRKRGYEMQKALDGVSLEVNKGEFFGIIGRNGSGKSTLLKILAGIYTPTKGDIKVNGSLTPFIELGVGFNPELTGRENVFLNGALLGFNRKQMQAMYKDIVEFAELERFMDQTLKNYSSGMQVRLAFSIATRAQGDILLLDEVLAVGDAAFQRKCFEYFQTIKVQKKTVVLVTHDMASVRSICTRVALLTNGKLDFIGDPERAADLYQKQSESDTKLFEDKASNKSGVSLDGKIVNKQKKGSFTKNDQIKLRLTLKPQRKLTANVVLEIYKENGSLVAGVNADPQIPPRALSEGKNATYEFIFPANQFPNGRYIINGHVFEAGTSGPVFQRSNMEDFYIDNDESGWGGMNLNGTWKEAK